MKSIRRYRCVMLLWNAINAAYSPTCMFDIHIITFLEFCYCTKLTCIMFAALKNVAVQAADKTVLIEGVVECKLQGWIPTEAYWAKAQSSGSPLHYNVQVYTPCFRKKVDPSLFHHIFALIAMNYMKISRNVQVLLVCCDVVQLNADFYRHIKINLVLCLFTWQFSVVSL